MGTVKRFIPKAERIGAKKAEEARQAVLDLELPDTAMEDILITIQRHETGGKLAEWNFNMLNPNQCLVVWDAIRQLDPNKRPGQVRHLFDLILTHIEMNTGLVTLTRDEMAEIVGTQPNNISRMMGTLEELGVIFRERLKIPGMRGQGKARYRLNPHVAWNGKLENREKQARETTPPLLTLMEGGKE